MRFFFQSKTANFKFQTALLMLGIFLLAFFVLAHPAFAAESSLKTLGAASGLPQESLPILIARIIRAILMTLGILTVVLVFYAGFLYMTAGGNPEKLKKAKGYLKNLIIGLFIIFSSYSIASFILNKLLEAAFGSGSITTTIKKYSEPLGASLGAGIIDSHYPSRNGIDIPRNTKIFVTFKEAIKPETIIDGFTSPCTYDVATPQQTPLCKTDLKTDAVEIFETQKGDKSKLQTNQVVVAVSDDHKTFVFDPVQYLGSAEKNVNYSILLTPKIQKEKGGDAFTGAYSSGYEWSFTVSTNIDLTPPYVIYAYPEVNSTIDRNRTIEITFNEAMDPIATTGIYGKDNKAFSNIATLLDPATNLIQTGIYEISNQYRTISFKTFDVCATDPCGSDVFCLPADKKLSVRAKAAPIDESNVPQAKLKGTTYDGVVDASGNSLDGNHDNKACGSETDKIDCPLQAKNDNYEWVFSTNNNIDKTVPAIVSLEPKVGEGGIDTQKDLTITFNTLLSAPTVNASSVSVWPENPPYPMWFSVSKVDMPEKQSVVHISHPPFVSSSQNKTQLYWPVLTQDVKGNNQFCLYPAKSETCKATTALPYCCNGDPFKTACKTDTGIVLPKE